MFVPTRQKDVCAHGYQPRVCGYTIGVIARLDRATQYSKDPVMIRKGRGVLDAPVKPGHDTNCVATACALAHPAAELVRLRKTLRRQAAGVGAGAVPLRELLHGRREFTAR